MRPSFIQQPPEARNQADQMTRVTRVTRVARVASNCNRIQPHSMRLFGPTHGWVGLDVRSQIEVDQGFTKVPSNCLTVVQSALR